MWLGANGAQGGTSGGAALWQSSVSNVMKMQAGVEGFTSSVATGALSGASYLSDGVTSTATLVAGEAHRVRPPWTSFEPAREPRVRGLCLTL